MERSGHGRLRRLHRPARPRGHRRRQPHHVRRAQRRQPLRCGVPDLRHDLAGLQHVRRLRLLPAAPATVGPTRSATTGRSPRAVAPGRDFYFANEYPMVRFLERTATTSATSPGVDTDRSGSAADEPQVFLSVGHDEYWTGAAARQREAARDAGVNLQFLCGNEMYWMRWEPSADASTRRTAPGLLQGDLGRTPRSTRPPSGPAPGAIRGSPRGQRRRAPENAADRHACTWPTSPTCR